MRRRINECVSVSTSGWYEGITWTPNAWVSSLRWRLDVSPYRVKATYATRGQNRGENGGKLETNHVVAATELPSHYKRRLVSINRAFPVQQVHRSLRTVNM